MQQTLQSLAEILLKAIPTAVLLLALLFYFRAVLFGPLEKILKQRDELTAGTRHAAMKCLKLAEEKIAEYDAKMRDAHSEVYRQQEEIRRGWLADQASQIASARDSSAASVKTAKEEVAKEMFVARATLSESASALADQVVSSVLSRRA